MFYFQNNVILECEKMEEKQMHSWWPEVLNVFVDRKNFSDVLPEQLESFYNCTSTLISNQVAGDIYSAYSASHGAVVAFRHQWSEMTFMNDGQSQNPILYHMTTWT